MMQISLHDVVGYISIAGFIFGGMRYVVIAPMKECIEKIEVTLLKMDEKMDENSERLARVEESAKSAHKRIDRIDKEEYR
ncbi:MAG: hypothetical protein Q4D58_00700 [Synergistaceae bacterium]|nr:hypothetical protein [Synergistaceae bacterium]